ncbi:phage tail tape measure protein [Streptomyces mobaraensis]|uniref:phage tail tape measure protein n=1 Tax=Streptomyces mobaraensis TaxID=35621 RepID=UPI0013DFC144|nr:phage tail tape measure protein [Streptomyces mobaraensis]
MAEVADLFVRLRAETAPFVAGMTRAGQSGETFAARMGGLGGMLTKVGKATTAVGIGFVAYGVKAAGDFQQQMNLLVTACGESQRNLKLVSDGVLSLARSTGTSTHQLAEGMYQVEKAGYRGADGLKVLKAAAQGAREEGADLKDVTNAMTSVMASYHLKASDSVRVMNAIKTAAGEGKMTMAEFSASLATVIPIASANKVSFAEVGGAIATLTQHGTSAREATQELASTIRSLAAPNNVAVQEMQRLGLSSTDVSTKLGQRGLTGTLDLLSQTVLSKMGPSGTVLLSAFNKTKQAAADADQMVKAMPPNLQALAQSYATGSISLGEWRQNLKTLPPEQANLLSQYATLQNKTNGFAAELKRGGPAAQTYTEAIKKMTGGAIGLNTTLQLTGENTEGFRERVKKVGASYNDASKDVEGWKVTQQSFNVQMGRLRESVTTAAIVVGTKLIPVILSVISFFEQHKSASMALAVVIGAVLTGSVLKFIGGALRPLMSTLGVVGRVMLGAVGMLQGVSWSGTVAGVQAVGTAMKTAALSTVAFSRAMAASALAGLRAAGAWVAQRVAMLAAAVAARVATIAQWALNIAMDANPIGAIILAVVALVAAIVWVATKTTWFQTAWKVTWAAVQAVGLAVWGWMKSTYTATVNGLVAAWHAVSGALSGSWRATWSTISAVARAVWQQGIVAVVLGALSALRSGLSSALAAIRGLWTSSWGAVRSFAASTWASIRSTVTSAINSARAAVALAVGAIGSSLSSIKSRALGALAGAGSWLYSAGADLIRGLLGGISSMAGAVTAKVRSLASDAVSGFKSMLEISSPSRVFKALGAFVMHGLLDGLTGSTARVRTATQRIARDLMVDFGSSHRALQRTVAHDNTLLMSLARQRDRVASRLKDAQKRVSDLWKDWTKARDEAAKSIMQNATIVAQAPADGGTLSSFDVVQRMRDQVQRVLQFAGNLQQLRAKGLRADLVQQIANAGVEQGGATAQALASATRGQIAEMNQLQRGMQSAADATGAAVADSMYGAGIKSADGLVRGLQSQQKKIEAQMMKIAKSMQSAIKRALGIRSPSRVFAELGQYIPQGLAQGIEGAVHHATRAATNLADAVVGAGRVGADGLALAGGGGGGQTVTVHQHLHLTVEGHVLTERRLRDVVEEQMLQLGARNSQTWQPYKR